DTVGCFLLGTALDQFPGEHESDDHACSVEIDVWIVAECLPNAVEIRREDSEAQQRLSAYGPVLQAQPCETKNGIAAVEDNGSSQSPDHEWHVLPKSVSDLFEETDVKRHAEIHDVHPQKCRDTKAKEKFAFFSFYFVVAGAIFLRSITQTAN